VRVPYLIDRAPTPQPSLGGGRDRPRPVLAVRVLGPGGDRILDGLLDSGSDDTIFPAWVGALVGLDLTSIPEHKIALAGRPQPLFTRFVPVELRISDGVQEAYEWPAVVGFAPVPLRRALLGQAGFLQFFNADFRGADREAILTTNPTFPGRRI
jgi:hypothetical protein